MKKKTGPASIFKKGELAIYTGKVRSYDNRLDVGDVVAVMDVDVETDVIGVVRASDNLAQGVSAEDLRHDLKVGDRVKALGLIDHVDFTGKTGTVVDVHNDPEGQVGIAFDEHHRPVNDGTYPWTIDGVRHPNFRYTRHPNFRYTNDGTDNEPFDPLERITEEENQHHAGGLSGIKHRIAMATKKKQEGKVDLGPIKPNSVIVENSTETQRIILPANMDKMTAAEELVRMAEEEQKINSYTRQYPGFYWEDVIVAVRKAQENILGWVNGKTVYVPFVGAVHPELVDVVVQKHEDGTTDTEKGFIGRAMVTNWSDDAFIETNLRGAFDAGIQAQARKGNEEQVNALFDEVGRILREESIFKGKAVIVEFKENKRLGRKEPSMEITYIHTNENIVLNDGTRRVVDILLTADRKEDGKRIYLFTGSYGNGKTETAMLEGVKAVQAGYTFMYCKSAEQLSQFLVLAKRYLPALVFMEDVDSVAGGSARTEVINDILNTLDGAELKGSNIKVIFTTNHPEKLNPALRRPGRMDQVLWFENPDADSKAEIISRLLGKVDGFDQLDIKRCVKALPDVQAAFIAEICGQARKYAQQMHGLNNDVFMMAVENMKAHIKLMSDKVDDGKGNLKRALSVVGEALNVANDGEPVVEFGDDEDDEDDDN